jgi:hypothetical protein
LRTTFVPASADEGNPERMATVCPSGTIDCRQHHGFKADRCFTVMPARMAEAEVAVVYAIHFLRCLSAAPTLLPDSDCCICFVSENGVFQ